MLARVRASRGRLPVGVVSERLDRAGLRAELGSLGAAGRRADALDARAAVILSELCALSPLSTPLLSTYLERIGRPLAELGFDGGALAGTHGYAAHLAVEADPAAYGATDVPVIGDLPPARRGRPPADLLNRVVRATRRGFEHIRAVDDDVWSGLCACVTYRVHEAAGADGPFAEPVVVDALVRLGWVLRQVDIHYRQEPERR